MARNNSAGISHPSFLGNLQMSSQEPSQSSPDSTDSPMFTPSHTPLHTPQTANTTPASLRGLEMSGKTKMNAPYDLFEMPPFVHLLPAPTLNSGVSLNPEYFSAYADQHNVLQSGPNTQAQRNLSSNAFAPHRTPSQEQFIVQQTSQAQGVRQRQTPNALYSPPLFDSPNTFGPINRNTSTPTIASMTAQQYHNSLSPQTYDQPLYNSMSPTAPAMTSQSGLFSGSNAHPNQPMRQMRTGLVDSQQRFSWANVETERQRQLQQGMLMARRQQQQTTVSQPVDLPSVVPQLSSHPSQGQLNRHEYYRHHPAPRTQPPVYRQANAQMHLPSQGMGIIASPSRENRQHLMKRPAEATQDYVSTNRRSIADPDKGQIQSTVRSSHLQQNVSTLFNGSNLHGASQYANQGRQYPQKVPLTPLQSGFATSNQQRQHKPHLTPIQDMSGYRRDSGPTGAEPANKRVKVTPIKDESRPVSGKHSSYSVAVPTSNAQDGRPENQITTPTRQQPVKTASLVSPPSNPIKVETSAPLQNSTKSRIDAQNNLLAPSTYPQEGKSEPEFPSDDVLASMLQEFIDNANTTSAVTQQQEDLGSIKTQQELLLAGPLTKEQNSKALVAGVIAEMKRRGPSVGTNPDLDTAAAPQYILEQRRKWSDQFRRDLEYASGGFTYVPARKVMESAAGYARQS